MFSRLFLIGSFSYLQVVRTYIKAYMSLNFGQIPPLTTELAALERLKNRCHHVISVDIDPIFFKLAGNKDMQNIMNEFEFQPNRTTDYGVSCPWASKKYPYRPYNGENGVSTFSLLFLIGSFWYFRVTRTSIKAWMSLNFLKWDLTSAHWTQVSDRCPLGHLLAHLSRRLTRWAYRMGLEPACVRACVRPSIHTFKHCLNISETSRPITIKFYLKHHWGWGKGCIRFWCRSDQNSGFHSNG